MTTKRPATYSYDELAARIEQVLGVAPSKSALRAAAATARRSAGTRPLARLTAGMPAPLPAAARTSPARFDAAAVERWLEHHPRRAVLDATEALRRALAEHRDVAAAVAAARTAGMSWRQITTTLNEHDGQQRSIAGVHKAYQRQDPRRTSS